MAQNSGRGEKRSGFKTINGTNGLRGIVLIKGIIGKLASKIIWLEFVERKAIINRTGSSRKRKMPNKLKEIAKEFGSFIIIIAAICFAGWAVIEWGLS